jgi:hypothetical protein
VTKTTLEELISDRKLQVSTLKSASVRMEIRDTKQLVNDLDVREHDTLNMPANFKVSLRVGTRG